MNEEIEYAEMLEIPVSTVNVIEKPRKKRRNSAKNRALPPPAENDKADLKDSLIAQINDKVAPPETDAPTPEQPSESLINYETPEVRADSLESEYSDRIDTVRLLSAAGKKKRRLAHQSEANVSIGETQNEAPVYEMNGRSRAARIVLGTEFALACALSATIFLTNVFMPNSGINAFFNGLNKTEAKGDSRTYADFTLSSVVSTLSETELALSDAGVLSFTDECMVYPAADGKIAEVAVAEDGTYIVKISHSDSFTGVFEGLNQVYYAVGDDVKAKVPMGFSKGEREVQVTMYSEGELLNCFQMTEEGCLAWVEKE